MMILPTKGAVLIANGLHDSYDPNVLHAGITDLLRGKCDFTANYTEGVISYRFSKGPYGVVEIQVADHPVRPGSWTGISHLKGEGNLRSFSPVAFTSIVHPEENQLDAKMILALTQYLEDQPGLVARSDLRRFTKSLFRDERTIYNPEELADLLVDEEVKLRDVSRRTAHESLTPHFFFTDTS